jgi:hypothetical protein
MDIHMYCIVICTVIYIKDLATQLITWNTCALGGFNFILFWNFNGIETENDSWYRQKEQNCMLLPNSLKWAKEKVRKKLYANL